MKEIFEKDFSLSRKRTRVFFRNVCALTALLAVLFASSGVTLAGPWNECNVTWNRSETPQVLQIFGPSQTAQLSESSTWTSFHASRSTSGDLGRWRISIGTRSGGGEQALPSPASGETGVSERVITVPPGLSSSSSAGKSVFRIRFFISGGVPADTGRIFVSEDGRRVTVIRIPVGPSRNDTPSLPPGSPDVPGAPGTPGTPAAPRTPGTPDTPGDPGDSGIPSVPGTPGTPGDGSGGSGESKAPDVPGSGNEPGSEEGDSAGQGSQKNAFLTDKEQKMLELVNAERERVGLDPLVADETLTRLARMKSEDMIEKGYFSHNSPTYGSPFDMMRKAGVKYTTAGENLAGAPTVERAHAGLMDSEGHRRNILNPRFKRIGIGIIEGGPYGLMVAQMFTG